MLVSNIESLESQDLFSCYSLPLKRFLCEYRGIQFIGVKRDEETAKNIWYFTRTDELASALGEWADRKITGDLFFKK